MTSHPALRTLYDKLWASHLAAEEGDGVALIYIDRHLLHEVSTPQAFEGLSEAGRDVRRPKAQLAVADHAVPTQNRDRSIADSAGRDQAGGLAKRPMRRRDRFFAAGNK